MATGMGALRAPFTSITAESAGPAGRLGHVRQAARQPARQSPSALQKEIAPAELRRWKQQHWWSPQV